MIKISLAMIVRNEEKVLARCLESYKDLVDEIIIVDTGSTDKTKLIAKNYTEKVYDFKWVDDFSKARNYSFSLCTQDYIIWTDADDVFNPKHKQDFINLKKQLPSFDVVMMKYDISFNEQNTTVFSYERERIVKNDGSFIWQDAVHEVLIPHGKIFHSQISIEHRPIPKVKQSNRNLKIYQKLLKQGVSFSPRQQYYYSRELMYNGKYKQAIKHFEKLLNMNNVWVENTVSACRDLAKCYSYTNQNEKAKMSLIRSFLYETPRAESCCQLADLFLSDKQYSLAIYWYKSALIDKPDIQSGAFIELEYYNIIPYLQLCVCYYYLNDYENAVYYNNLAGKINPLHPSFLHNKNLFDNY